MIVELVRAPQLSQALSGQLWSQAHGHARGLHQRLAPNSGEQRLLELDGLPVPLQLCGARVPSVALP